MLEKINSPEDLKKLNIEEKEQLAKEIREYMQRYSIIKMDMFPKKNSLVYTRKNIVFFKESFVCAQNTCFGGKCAY